VETDKYPRGCETILVFFKEKMGRGSMLIKEKKKRMVAIRKAILIRKREGGGGGIG